MNFIFIFTMAKSACKPFIKLESQNSSGTMFPEAICVLAALGLTQKMLMEGGGVCVLKIVKGSETESLHYSNYVYLFTFPLCAALLRFSPRFSVILSWPFQ